jgi:hypothetical protein
LRQRFQADKQAVWRGNNTSRRLKPVKLFELCAALKRRCSTVFQNRVRDPEPASLTLYGIRIVENSP